VAAARRGCYGARNQGNATMTTPDRRPRVLFAGPEEDWPDYAPHLRRAAAARGIEIELSPSTDRPERVDYLVYNPKGPIQDFAPFTGLKAVLSLWAGVERIVGNPTLTVPLTRMVDEGLELSMRDYVAGHVLRHHLGIDGHILNQDGIWRHDDIPPLARERTVAILGQGALGRACAETVAGLGFRTLGWSRAPKPPHDRIELHHGEAGLDAVLSQAEIVVLLLPATQATENLINADRLARLPRGAFLINPGRGTLIDDAALLAALDSGQIAHATLDVFREEPLPPDHPFWTHPRVTVTPHIAAETRPSTAAEVIAENIRRAEAGEPLLHRVDRSLGY
jgi:glyoxylate/hydroxypyruvate reductase